MSSAKGSSNTVKTAQSYPQHHEIYFELNIIFALTLSSCEVQTIRGSIRYHIDTIRYDTIRYDMIRYETIWYNTIRNDTIWYNRYDTIDTIRSKWLIQCVPLGPKILWAEISSNCNQNSIGEKKVVPFFKTNNYQLLFINTIIISIIQSLFMKPPLLY